MNSTILRAVAASWLRYDRKCWLVTFERGLEYNNNPDVLAVNPNRFLIEVEVKISMSDFKADAKKRKWVIRGDRPTRSQPKFFYYMVPPELVEKVQPELKPGHGLLTLASKHINPHTALPDLRCVVAPKANANALRLNVHDIAKLVKHQSGTLCHLAAFQGRIVEEVGNYEARAALIETFNGVPNA